LSEPVICEFEISTEIKDLGFFRIYAVDKTLFACGLTKIQSRYYRHDLQKTMNALKKAFVEVNEFDIETIDKLCVYLSQAWIKAEDTNNCTTADNAQNSEANIINEEIMQLGKFWLYTNSILSDPNWVARIFEDVNIGIYYNTVSSVLRVVLQR